MRLCANCERADAFLKGLCRRCYHYQASMGAPRAAIAAELRRHERAAEARERMAGVEAMLRGAAGLVEGATIEQRRSIAGMLIERVEVTRRGGGRGAVGRLFADAVTFTKVTATAPAKRRNPQSGRAYSYRRMQP